MKKVQVTLKDGTQVCGDEFEEQDLECLKQVFHRWMSMNADLKSLGGRNLNVPDVFSEGLFCLGFDAVRTNKTAHSYDCVIKATGEGVQVKSASIESDCTSFGPTSTWDRLFFADFVPHGVIDGEVWFYEISSEDIYNLVLNKRKGETFRDQQRQGRRPRLSIKQLIIKEKGLQPVKIMRLND